jgi:hypothetical protein
MKAIDVITPVVAAADGAATRGGASFVPLFSTLGGGVGAVTLILFLTLSIDPTVGVVLGFVVMVLFVAFVLGGMQRLLSDEGPGGE